MHIIEQIGSYAGLAAVVGLAVLSVLYFSQARDVRRLREWAGRAPERAEAGHPVPASVAQRVVAQPQPKPAVPGQAAPTPGQPVPTPGQPAPAQAQPVPNPGTARPGPPPVPGAPAGVPALAAAAGARPATATASTGPGPATPAGQGQQAPQVEKPDDETDTGETPAERDSDETGAPDEAVPVVAGVAEGRPAAATPAAQAAGAEARAHPAPAPESGRDSTEESDAVPSIAAATAAAIQSPPPANSGAATPAAQTRTPVTPPPPSSSPRLPDRSAPPPRVPPGSETRILPPPGRPPGLASSASERPNLSGPRLAALIVAGVLVLEEAPHSASHSSPATTAAREAAAGPRPRPAPTMVVGARRPRRPLWIRRR